MTEDDAIAGLESLSAEPGANLDELPTTPEDITEAAPEQLSESDAGQPEAEPAEDAIFPEEVEPMADTSISQPTEEEPAPAAEGTTEASQAAETAAQMKEDDAFAWLESLAAKQGANPDELLTRPEDRGETPPEWLSQPESPALGETIAAAATAAAVGAMLSKDEEPDKPAAEPTPPATAEPAAEGLEWLEGIEQEGVAEQTQAQPAVASEWLPVEPLAEEAAGGEVEPGSEETTWESIPSFTAEIARDATAPEAPSSATEEMPDWLRTSLEETPAAPEAQELPEWMAATGEVPAQAATALPEAVGQEPEPASSEMLTGSSENERFAAEPETVSGIQIARPTPPEGDDAIFEQAQVDLQRGQLDQAVKGYSRLIKKGKLLDEIIYDLRDGTYRYPVDVMIWLTLGDAYKRANRLQEALDAYTKAEGLLR
jgi:tetratricopeptide (TPR) repeat protein